MKGGLRSPSRTRARLIVHAGAWNIPIDEQRAHELGVLEAAAAAFAELQRGLGAVGAAEMAVSVMEENPALNAGRGAVLNAVGEIELDASIMDGRSLASGAVGAVKGMLHPVRLARVVMEQTSHHLLVGEGAVALAKVVGIQEVPMDELLTQREQAYFDRHVRDNPLYNVRPVFAEIRGDTVGAVAMDEHGHLAAATSTGGTPGKLPGRVGDSPIVGAGLYADNELGAVSATGHGEQIMTLALSQVACQLMDGLVAQDAVDTAVALLSRRLGGMGGLIAIDRQGNYGWGHSTPKMAVALVNSSGVAQSFLARPLNT